MKKMIILIAAAIMLVAMNASAQLPRPIGQNEVDWFYDVADSSGFNTALDRIDKRGAVDSARVDDLTGKIARIPTTTAPYTGHGAYFLRAAGPFAQSWRDSTALDAFAAAKGMSRDDAAQLAEWLDLKRSFRTAAGRRQTAEMYLTWLENGGRAADMLSATGVQVRTPTTGSSTGPFASETSVNVALAAIAALEDTVKVLRDQIKPLAEAAAQAKVSGEINALRTTIKEVANKAGQAANDRASKDERRAAVTWLANYGQ